MSSRWLISTTMVAACVIAAWLQAPAQAQFAAPAAKDKAKPTAALIDFDKAPLVALLETELLGSDAATWVERTEIAKVLDEQKLQTLFAPTAGSERARIGKVLKADVLVLIRSGKAENVPYLDIVVSEVTRGLRLVNQRIPESANADEDVARIVKLVTAGMQRQGQQIQAIYSVPPFLSEDLLYEHDDLRGAYSRLVEQRLLEHPGILVVELAEAEAITKELTLAAEKIDRQLPIMLLGQYRNEGKGDDRRVTVQLALKRGATELGKNTNTLKPTEVPAYLLEKTGLVASRLVGGQAPVSDPKVEAKQLALRSKDFLKLGNWDEALALNQASLLLDFQQPDLHHDAVVILSKFVLRHWYHAPIPLPQAQLGLSYYLRGIYHELSFYNTGGEAISNGSLAMSLRQVRGVSNYLIVHPYSSAETRAFVETVRQAHCERFLVRVEQLLTEKRDQEALEYLQIATDLLSPQAAYDARLRLIEKFQKLPGSHDRTRLLTSSYSGLSDQAAEKAYLALLVQSRNAEVRAAGVEMQQRFDDAMKRASLPLPPEPAPRKPVAATADGQVRLVPATFNLPVKYFDGCLPVSPGLDVFWARGELYFMREKGVLTQVWKENERNWSFPGYLDPRNKGGVCFDGKYVWATVTHFREPPYLVVIDTTSDKQWKFTTAEGLPFVKPQEVDVNEQRLAIAPIAPGKICAIGGFGRAWIATITLTASAPQIEIFHEAKQQPKLDDLEQWKDKNVAFQPTFVHVMTNPASPSEQLLVIGRGAANHNVCLHPLVVNPATRQVEVLSDVLGARRPAELCAYQGALYFMEGRGDKVGLFRIAMPGPKRELVAEYDCEGLVTVLDNQLAIVGQEWWLVNLTDKTLRSAGPAEWHYQTQYTPITRFVPIPQDAARLELLVPSNHYGVLMAIRAGKNWTISQAVLEPKSGKK